MSSIRGGDKTEVDKRGVTDCFRFCLLIGMLLVAALFVWGLLYVGDHFRVDAVSVGDNAAITLELRREEGYVCLMHDGTVYRISNLTVGGAPVKVQGEVPCEGNEMLYDGGVVIEVNNSGAFLRVADIGGV